MWIVRWSDASGRRSVPVRATPLRFDVLYRSLLVTSGGKGDVNELMQERIDARPRRAFLAVDPDNG
jgi:hypothetical protein